MLFVLFSLGKLNHSFTRFLLVGLLNTAVGLSATYILLNAARLGYWPSTLLGNGVGAVVSFVLNRSFTFRSEVHWLPGMVKFGLVIGICYVLAYSIGMEAVQWLLPLVWERPGVRVIENMAVLCGMGLYTVLSYSGHRWFTFRKAKPHNASEQ